MVIVLPFAWPHLKTDLPRVWRKKGIVLLLTATGGAAFSTLQYVALHFTTALNMGVVGSVDGAVGVVVGPWANAPVAPMTPITTSAASNPAITTNILFFIGLLLIVIGWMSSSLPLWYSSGVTDG